MKAFLVLAALAVSSMAQRPTYAGSNPIGRPGLASRFKDTDEITTSRVYNRFAEDGTTSRIPVDALGDGELVDRLQQWPREHRPFWLLNADAIEAHRNPQSNGQNLASTNNFQQRSGFGNGGQQNGIQDRNEFQDNWDPNAQGDTRTIRPVQQRSSFLSSRP